MEILEILEILDILQVLEILETLDILQILEILEILEMVQKHQDSFPPTFAQIGPHKTHVFKVVFKVVEFWAVRPARQFCISSYVGMACSS